MCVLHSALVGKHSGHGWKEIEEFFTRDRYMNAVAAKNYGLVDEILGDTSNLVVLGKNGEISLGGQTLIDNKE